MFQAFLNIVAMHKIEFELLNVKTTFLYREIDDDIYMQQSEGFIVKGKEDYMCLLKKLLYSLKQSLRLWYKRFDSFYDCSWSQKESFCDNYVDFKNSDDGSFVYLLIYVDDMLIVAKDNGE